MFRRLWTSIRNWFQPPAPAAVSPPVEPGNSPPNLPPGDAAGSESSPAAAPPTPQETAAAQSILENESLTADLDDTAADALLEWGVANARMIARGMMGIFDSPTAGANMEERLSALRGMMRSVNRYTAGVETSDSALDKILQQAAMVYGERFAPPSAEERAAFLRAQTTLLHNPAQLVSNLRRFIEEQGKGSGGYG